MKSQAGRFSGYLRPFQYILDLTIVNILAYLLLPFSGQLLYYHLTVSVFWLVISWNVEFYEVYRFTKGLEIANKVIKQYFIFLTLNFAYLGYFLKTATHLDIFQFVTFSVLIISLNKFFVFFFLKKFRAVFGGNFRRVVIIGDGENSKLLADFFQQNIDFGYKLVKQFAFQGERKVLLEQVTQFVVDEKIDEIYCSLQKVEKEDLDYLIDFADNNLKVLKFLPDEQEVLSSNMKFVYYGYIPIASLRNIPLDDFGNQLAKRTFDIVFSLLVIVGVMSWLIPIMAILIKFESKGPVFFKQKRNGLNYHAFDCYKFRSMKPNRKADVQQVSKNDPRITKIGAFMRKTSIDELPQFFNVLLGDMSVVGPRPHMLSETERFAQNIDKFMVRHFVKPGITGLAQTKGYRGEVETDQDIINRVKQDIFYLENWSLLLDLKIILMTVYNAVKGEEKAY